MPPETIRVGARSSKLSQAQTSAVLGLIKAANESLAIELVPVKTLGDRLPPYKRGAVDAKGAFTGDLETMLLEGRIDVAVHSMKDLPSRLTDGLSIGATPKRADPRDVLLSRTGSTLTDLPAGGKVGTSSLRRKAQLLALRRDIEVVDLHGNVDTRLRKMETETDAIVLAHAGLERLGQQSRITQIFSVEEMVPAVGQGTIAVQMREGDTGMARILSKIDDETTRQEAVCERAFSERLGGDCYVPVGGCARSSGRAIEMVGMIADEDGTRVVKRRSRGPPEEANSLGAELADELLGITGKKALRGRPA